MGTQVTPDLLERARKMMTLEDAMKYYGVVLVENTRETVLHGHCPLSTHVRNGGRSFRVKLSPTGKMLRWECLSTFCQEFRRLIGVSGNDVVAFVAAMEGNDLECAAQMILSGELR